MPDGYWVISVNRATGVATTSELITDKDTAYQLSLDTETAEIATTVVAHKEAAPSRREETQ
ncbi:hypothetical protein [Mycobacteroides abscessus]|nr:hypothetical protein [Mycobacteroides abscessus]